MADRHRKGISSGVKRSRFASTDDDDDDSPRRPRLNPRVHAELIAPKDVHIRATQDGTSVEIKRIDLVATEDGIATNWVTVASSRGGIVGHGTLDLLRRQVEWLERAPRGTIFEFAIHPVHDETVSAKQGPPGIEEQKGQEVEAVANDKSGTHEQPSLDLTDEPAPPATPSNCCGSTSSTAKRLTKPRRATSRKPGFYAERDPFIEESDPDYAASDASEPAEEVKGGQKAEDTEISDDSKASGSSCQSVPQRKGLSTRDSLVRHAFMSDPESDSEDEQSVVNRVHQMKREYHARSSSNPAYEQLDWSLLTSSSDSHSPPRAGLRDRAGQFRRPSHNPDVELPPNDYSALAVD